MFTEGEINILAGIIRAEIEAQRKDGHTTKRLHDILEKVIGQNAANIRMQRKCASCSIWVDYEPEDEQHFCVGCGQWICEICFDDSATCDAPKCQDAQKWEEADLRFDRAREG